MNEMRKCLLPDKENYVENLFRLQHPVTSQRCRKKRKQWNFQVNNLDVTFRCENSDRQVVGRFHRRCLVHSAVELSKISRS